MQAYDKSLGNEVYHIVLGQSVLFREYIGMTFANAAYLSYSKGVTLVGVQKPGQNITLNPGDSLTLVSQCCLLLCNVKGGR